MSRYGDLFKTEPVIEKEPLREKNSEQIYSGIIHCNGVDIVMEYDYPELTWRRKYLQSLPKVAVRKERPLSPLSIYKDEEKNAYLNFFWQEFQRAGIIDVLKNEQNFRTAKIQLSIKYDCYPLKFTPKSTGYLYDDSFIDLFPEKISRPFSNSLKKGYKLITLKNLPFMMKKDNFRVIKELSSHPQLF